MHVDASVSCSGRIFHFCRVRIAAACVGGWSMQAESVHKFNMTEINCGLEKQQSDRDSRKSTYPIFISSRRFVQGFALRPKIVSRTI